MNIRVVSTHPNDSQVELLKNAYKKSMQIYRQTVDAAKSKTLEELYTEEFRPSVQRANKTTVKSLETGKPVSVDLRYRLVEGKLNGSHRLMYTVVTPNGKTLGKKGFGIEDKEGEKRFAAGFIKSKKNDIYAGVQIRLLQAACEEAQRNGIKFMPLSSLLPAAKFHTMMGFRPTRSFNVEIKSMSDITKAITDNYIDFKKAGFEPSEVVPILSKKDGKYYFDRNRTIYCATMKRNEKMLKNGNKRHLKLSDEHSDESINMIMQGREFNKWLERIKGFEIMPKEGVIPKKQNAFKSLYDLISVFFE